MDWAKWFETLFTVTNQFVFLYILFVCGFYFLLFIRAFTKLDREWGLHKVEPYKQLQDSPFLPPLSILVPAYNEERGIVASVLSLITGSGRLDYPEYEVIVINDGSTDETLAIMKERFQLVEVKHKVFYKPNGMDTKPIIAVYQSRIYPNLLLIDKENGGKADALNAGIIMARYPYFASIDGDTILEPESFLKIMKPIVENQGEEIIATGGNILIANGSDIDQGQLREVRLSKNPLVIMQAIEYMRAFLMGRLGLSRSNILLIISGAFGVFKTSRVIEAGGYSVGTIGEDMELVVRLHRLNKERKWGARIEYAADPVCYTEAPEDFKFLRHQRVRWYRGLFESLWAHRGMFLNPKYGRIGLVALPYFVIIELLGPLIEFIGYFVTIIGFFLGDVYIQFSISLLFMMMIYGSFLSVGAVLLEEWRLGKHQKIGELNKLVFMALTEAFWYRPLMTFWRASAFISIVFLRRNEGWIKMKRKGIST